MGEGFGVLVEAGGKTDGVGEIETEDPCRENLILALPPADPADGGDGEATDGEAMGRLRRQQAQEPRREVEESGHGGATLSRRPHFFQMTSPPAQPNIAPC